MTKKNSSTLIIVIIAALVIIGVAVFMYANKGAAPAAKPEAATPPAQQNNNKTTDTVALGFAATYSPDLFTESDTAAGALLSSAYTVTDNPSGLAGKEIVQDFSISFTVKQGSVLDTFKSENLFAFNTLFPDGTEKGFVEPNEPGWGKYSAGGRDGYQFTEGLEGINDSFVFLPLNKTHTLEVTLKFFDSSVVGMDQPAAKFPMIEQMNAFTSVMDSLTYTAQ